MRLLIRAPLNKAPALEGVPEKEGGTCSAVVALRGDDVVVARMPNGYVIPFSTYALSRRCRTLNKFRRGWAHFKRARSVVALGMALSCIAGDGMHADSIRPCAVMVFSRRSGLRSHQMASYQRNNSYFVKGRGVRTHLGVPPPLSSSVFFLSSLSS